MNAKNKVKTFLSLMTRILIVCGIMFLLLGLGNLYASDYNAEPPHIDYRPGYSGGCGGGAACHTVNAGFFLPGSIVAYPQADYTSFCLSCHNVSGEAHEKSAGWASTNAYINFTGLDPTLSYSGSSHSWNGLLGNAGTRRPALPGFQGYTHISNGMVRCQTCHTAMGKTSEEQNIDWESTSNAGGLTRYRFDHYTATLKYLSHYVKVYRSTGSMDRPLNSRTKKQYLVDPAEYSYNNRSAMITFNSPQSQFSYIYVDITEPYLRVGNSGNAICVDCHNNRNNASISHAPGTGAASSHPVGVNFGYNFGLHSTLKPLATGNTYIENGQVLCTSCHKPHNAASGNGQILRETDESALCSDCHKTKLDGYSTAGSVGIHNGTRHSGNNEPATVCLDCHTTHGSNNIMLIKNVINGKAINFQNFTGPLSFGPDTGYGVCEVCHSHTSHHLSDNASSGQGHNAGLNCTQCHPHSNGFSPSGACDVCHGFPPGSGRGGPNSYGWADTTGQKHMAHMTYLNTARFGYLTGLAACNCCHPGKPSGKHPEGLDTAFINTTSHIYWQGAYGVATFSPNTTVGQKNTADDFCTNVACHFKAGTRTWGDTPAACDSCHEYPGISANSWPAGNGHNVRFAGVTTAHLPAAGYNAATDSYAVMTANPSRCGKCHPNNQANHMNGVINVSAGGNAACGSGGFTFNVATSLSDVTCSNVRCHSGTTTPNWYGGTVSCGDCHGNSSKTGEPHETPEDKDNCSNTGRGLHGVHMNYSSASYGKGSSGNRGTCDYCHVTPGGSYPTATHNNGFVTITGRFSSGRQNYNSAGLTYDFTSKTCANACHRNRSRSAAWGNYTAAGTKLACSACHDDVVDKTGLSGAHAVHLNSAITVNGGSLMGAAGDAGCVNCHPDNTKDQWSQGKADNGTRKAYPHASDGTNVVPDNAVVNANVGASKAGLNTTCTGSCHQNTIVAKWGDPSLNCDACHYYRALPTSAGNYSSVVWLRYSHSTHFNAVKDCQICHTYPAITCSNCHPVPTDTSHAHTLPPVSDNAVVFSNLSWVVGTHTCSNTGGNCHGVGVLTPDWTAYGQ